jgi:hypothetical protein
MMATQETPAERSAFRLTDPENGQQSHTAGIMSA